jgi:hypothetical protein
MINTFVTNVHGPSDPLTFNGSVIREIIPVSGALGNVTVAFAVLSYVGTLTVTVVADRDQCADLPVLVDALQMEFDTLISTNVKPRAASASSTSRSPRRGSPAVASTAPDVRQARHR